MAVRSSRLGAATAAAALAVASAAAYGAAQGCSSDKGVEAGVADGGGGDVVVSDGGGDGLPVEASGDALETSVDAAPPPVGVPTGWLPWPDYDPACQFYYPPSRDLLPTPIGWEACDPTKVMPSGIACQQIRVDWPGGLSHAALGYLGTDVDGTPIAHLIFRTSLGPSPGGTYYAAARLDGQVRWALYSASFPTCALGQTLSNADGFFVWHAYGPAKGQGGALGGSLDTLRPRLLDAYSDGSGHDYSAGRPGWLTNIGFALDLHPWGGGAATHVIDPSKDNGMQSGNTVFFHDAMFWDSSSDAVARMRVWTAATGPQILFGYGLATDKGVGDLGTDGHDMVWLEGTGRTSGVLNYADESFWTAPFTTDPASVAATRRKLTAGYIRHLTLLPVAVGCGHAAYTVGLASAPAGDGIAVVRISDGQHWWIPTGSGAWQNQEPRAVWCADGDPAHAEVVVDVSIPPARTLARIRVDSLGAGDPAAP